MTAALGNRSATDAKAHTPGESEAAPVQAAVDAAGAAIPEAAKRLGIRRNTIWRTLR